MDYAPHIARLATPIGMVEVTGDAAQITSVTILSEGAPPPLGAPPDTPVAEAVVQLAAKLLYMLSRVGLPPIILSYVSLEEYGIWATCFIVISYLGMSTFDHSLYKLYTAGQITREQAIDYADSKTDVSVRIRLNGPEAPELETRN